MFSVDRKSFLQGIGGVIAILGLGACGKAGKGTGGATPASVDVSGLDAAEAERARAEVRRAIGLLLDRGYICRDIAQADQVPANTVVCPGVQEPDGTDFAHNAGAGEGWGYFDVTDEALMANYEEALAILRKYYTFDEERKVLTDFPPLEYLYFTSNSNKAIGEYIQSALASVGIGMSLENQEFATFLNTRNSGNYTLACGNWAMDYTDPICLLDLWTSRSGNNEPQLGKDGHADICAYDLDLTDLGYDVAVTGGTWAETYDVLIDTLKGERDQARRFRLMHLAEDMVMSTGAICPLYYLADPHLIRKSVKGYFGTPLGRDHFEGCTVDGKGDSISVSFGLEPETLDPALISSTSGGTTIEHLFSGLTRWAQRTDGTYEIVADCAEELTDGTAHDDGTVTYTYTLREGLTWSDGEPLVARDFEFAWKRAAAEDTGSPFGELFKVIAGYPNSLAVTATDERTLEVTTAGPVGFWDQLLAFPGFVPVREDVVASESWATNPKTLVCNGAYTLSEWSHGSYITLTRRDGYWNADKVTMREIRAFLSDDANTCLRNWETGDWQFVRSIPTNERARIKRQYPDEYVVAPLAGTYYLCWNVNTDILPS